MSNCSIIFEQMELLNKKSDTNHADNDWMTIIWSINGQVARTDTFPLRNAQGSVVLDSGNVIPRFSSEIACNESDFVSATFSIVNLGSTDLGQQAEAAGKIAQGIAQKVTELYLEVAQQVLRSGVGEALGVPQLLSDATAELIDRFSGKIVDAIGAAFEGVVLPILNELGDLFGVVIGRPNCNGDVLHDTVVFQPRSPNADVALWKIYTASSITGCGSAARTSTHMTLQRTFEQPRFPTTPPPKISIIEVADQPVDSWIDTWAEDVNPPQPLIRCTISPSTVTSGKLSISIIEDIDRRFNARFEASADAMQPVPKAIQFLGSSYEHNVFGSIAPWFRHNRPGDLVVHAWSVAPTANNVRQLDAEPNPAASSLSRIRLSWQRQNAGPLQALPITINTFQSVGEEARILRVDTILLAEQGVTLQLYGFFQDETRIGYAVRYQRAATVAYTAADVLLVRWNPVR